MAIHEITVNTQLSENIVIDTSKDAVVINGVSKIFKKPRPLIRWSGKKESSDYDRALGRDH